MNHILYSLTLISLIYGLVSCSHETEVLSLRTDASERPQPSREVKVSVKGEGFGLRAIDVSAFNVRISCDGVADVDITTKTFELPAFLENCNGILTSFTADGHNLSNNDPGPWLVGGPEHVYASGNSTATAVTTVIQQLQSPLSEVKTNFIEFSFKLIQQDADVLAQEIKVNGEIIISGEPIPDLFVASVGIGGPGKLRVFNNCQGAFQGTTIADLTCSGDALNSMEVLIVPYNGEAITQAYFQANAASLTTVAAMTNPRLETNQLVYRANVADALSYVIAYSLPASGSYRYAIISK
jgi:hypothetical protein